VWWSTEHTYKNAITNELFLLTSAAGYLRTKNESYLENANKVIITWSFSITNPDAKVTGMVLVYVFHVRSST
jgi:hypothetical protein